MSGRIDQLVCTHCTYGTSYLHRRDDHLREQTFEYSVRAGSVDRNTSHDTFRTLEPYLHYELPGDTPGEQITRRKASDSPRRLVYLPDVDGRAVIVQVCYRALDTQGRPGSYFAHALVTAPQPSSATSFITAADALQLWGSSAWLIEDSPRLGFDLPGLNSLQDMPGYGGFVSENHLLQFLLGRDVAGGTQSGLPPRWRGVSADDRQRLLSSTLQAFLELSTDRRQSVLLACEPEIAALIFFGVARLLPRSYSPLLSISTFEPGRGRPQTALAATTFHDPQKSRLPAEAFVPEQRGYAIDTWHPGGPEPFWNSHITPRYARRMVEILVNPEQGWKTVDRLLPQMGTTPQRANLEELLCAEERLSILLKHNKLLPTNERPDVEGPIGSPHLVKRLSAALFERQRAGGLESFCKNTNRALEAVRRLGAKSRTREECELALALLRSFPPDAEDLLGKVLNNESLADSVRLGGLVLACKRYNRTPPGCEWIWTQQPEWLVRLLSALPVEHAETVVLQQLHRVERSGAATFETCLRSTLQTLTLPAKAGGSPPPPPPPGLRPNPANAINGPARPGAITTPVARSLSASSSAGSRNATLIDARVLVAVLDDCCQREQTRTTLWQLLRRDASLHQQICAACPGQRGPWLGHLLELASRLHADPHWPTTLDRLRVAEAAGLFVEIPEAGIAVKSWEAFRQKLHRFDEALGGGGNNLPERVWNRIRSKFWSSAAVESAGVAVADAAVPLFISEKYLQDYDGWSRLEQLLLWAEPVIHSKRISTPVRRKIRQRYRRDNPEDQKIPAPALPAPAQTGTPAGQPVGVGQPAGGVNIAAHAQQNPAPQSATVAARTAAVQVGNPAFGNHFPGFAEPRERVVPAGRKSSRKERVQTAIVLVVVAVIMSVLGYIVWQELGGLPANPPEAKPAATPAAAPGQRSGELIDVPREPKPTDTPPVNDLQPADSNGQRKPQ